MKKFIYLILLLSMLGTVLSGVLVFQHYYPDSDFSTLSCGDSLENSCITVSQSKYSKLFGIPLATYGLLFYLTIIFILLIADYAEASYYKISSLLLLPLITLSLIIDLVLAGLLVKIGEVCLLCVSTYLINIAIFILTFLWVKKITNEENTSLINIYKDMKKIKIDTAEKKVALSSFTLFLILLTFSVFSSSYILKVKTTNPGINHQSIMHFLNRFYSKPTTNYTHPDNGLVLGNPEAKVTIHVYTDFLCSYCYRFYKMEKYLLSKFKGKINFIYYNFPLDSDCNEFVRKTVYKNSCVASQSFFAASQLGVFQDYLVQHFNNYERYHHSYYFKTALFNLSKVLKKNDKEIPTNQLTDMFKSEEINSMLQKHVETSEKNGIKGTPTIFIADRLLDRLPPKEIFSSIIEVELKRFEER